MIDNAIMELGTIQAIPNEDLSSIQGDPEKAFFGLQGDGYDFLLVPQGGLKGTSKPVLYRIRLTAFQLKWFDSADKKMLPFCITMV